MCIIELVDFNDTYTTDKPKKKAKSTRRAGAKKATPVETDESTEEFDKVYCQYGSKKV